GKLGHSSKYKNDIINVFLLNAFAPADDPGVAHPQRADRPTEPVPLVVIVGVGRIAVLFLLADDGLGRGSEERGPTLRVALTLWMAPWVRGKGPVRSGDDTSRATSAGTGYSAV